jgi:hypothetical protein
LATISKVQINGESNHKVNGKLAVGVRALLCGSPRRDLSSRRPEAASRLVHNFVPSRSTPL